MLLPIFHSVYWFIASIYLFILHQLTDRLGFEVPTLIQAQSIPTIILGRHVYPCLF